METFLDVLWRAASDGGGGGGDDDTTLRSCDVAPVLRTGAPPHHAGPTIRRHADVREPATGALRSWFPSVHDNDA